MTSDVQLPGWWYLSFAGPIDGDERDIFRGGVFVEADEIIGATWRAHALKINPGGSVMGVPVPEGYLPAAEYRNRVLTKKEILIFWPDAKSVREIERDSALEQEASTRGES